jgi:DNA primase
MDVLVLHDAGEPRAVAANSSQARYTQLKLLADSGVTGIVICLDPDHAGRAGTMRTIETCCSLGLAVRVAPDLPDATDADVFVRKAGIDAWRARIDRAVDGYMLYANNLIHQHGGTKADARQRAACLRAAADFASCRAPWLDDSLLSARFWPFVRAGLKVDDTAISDAMADAIARRRAERSARGVPDVIAA